MKKIRIYFASVLVAFSALLLSCNFDNLFSPSWNDGLKGWLDEYTNSAMIEEHKYSTEPYRDAANNSCISSERSFTVTMYMRNPQGYKLDASVNFPNLSSSIDRSKVTIVQTDLDTVILTLPQAFLIASDEGQDISPTVMLKEPMSGRSFPDYTIPLRCNTYPPAVDNFTIMNDGANHYILAFDMPNALEISIRHKDISKISINGTEYDVSIDNDGGFSIPDSKFSIEKPSGYLAFNNKEFIHNNEGRSVYYSTGDELTSEDVTYTLALIDSARLSTSQMVSTTVPRVNMPVIIDVLDNVIPDDSSIAMPVLDEKNSNFTIILPDGDSDGNPVSGSSVYYKMFYGADVVTDIYDMGIISEKHKFTVSVGTWNIECYAYKLGYEKSNLMNTKIRVVDSYIFISGSRGSDNMNVADGTVGYPYKTINGALADINSRHMVGQDSAELTYTLCILDELSGEENKYIPAGTRAAGLIIEGYPQSSAVTPSLENLELAEGLSDSFNVMLTNISAGGIKVSGGSASLKAGAKVQNAEVSTRIKMGADAVISDILTMNPGSVIEIVEGLTQTKAATITPSTYINDWQIIADNEYITSDCSKFALTPNPDAHSGYNWRITEKGVLIEEETGNITITVCEEESDINVSKNSSGKVVTFVPDGGYDSYEWEVDGTVISSGTSYPGVSLSGNSLVCDTENWVKGVYDIFLGAKKDGLNYSYHVQITKSE